MAIKVYGMSHPEYKSCSLEEIYEYFADKTEGCLDTETEGKDPHQHKIVSMQLGDVDNQFFIDARKVDVEVFKALLERKEFTWLLQNAKFDYKMLKHRGIYIENIYDTMLAEMVAYCGYEDWGFGLAKLVERYCGEKMNKEERIGFTNMAERDFSKAQIVYACKDLEYLQKIRDKQMWRIKEHNLEYCLALENQCLKALGDIEYNGMILNSEKWGKIAENTAIEVEQIKKELDDIVRKDGKLAPVYVPPMVQGNLFGFEQRDLSINYASPIQILKILKTLGFNPEGTDERELTKLKNKHVFPSKLLDLREKAKILSTYGLSFLEYINPITGKVHTSFWQIKDTGRVSSGSKDDNAPNLQNLPAKNEFRNCFEARKGFKWVSIDYSGQELRLMADGSGEQGFIDVLNSGEDLHCYAGSMMFKKTITKADKKERDKAKTINFGKPYGMGVDKLADTLGIPKTEAQDLFTMYAKTFPTLNGWLDKLGKFAKKNKYSVTFAPCKRKRFYPDMDRALTLRKMVKFGDKATWREILMIEGQTERNGGNSPIQGSGADICKEALVEVRKLIKRYRDFYKEDVAFLICTVHDAIDVEVREDLAQQFSKAMAKIMIDCGNKYVSKVKMEVDITITDHWQK